MKALLRAVPVVLFFLALGTGRSVNAQTRKTVRAGKATGAVGSSVRTGVPTDRAAQRRVDAFMKVWSTLNQNYFDPTFSGLDWDKIRTEFLPRVRAARTDNELYSLLTEMIGRLKRSHLAIITPEVYQTIERAKVEAKTREVERAARVSAGTKGGSALAEPVVDVVDPLAQYGLGLELRLVDNRFVITRIGKGSAADAAGLNTGYIIEKINGVSLSELLRRIDAQKVDAAKVKKYLPFEIVNSFLNGERDSAVALTYFDETNLPRDIVVPRERLKSETVSLGSSFPDRQLQFEAYPLNDDVGYIKFNIFVIPVIGKFCDAISEFRDKKAIVIDLRGNFGGVLASMVALAGMLTDSSIDLGTSIYKSGSEELTASSKNKNFKGKVVFLVDHQTVSAAEVFAAAMQDAGRAVVVGEVTSGEALPSVAVDLPTGAVLLYPIANYRSPAGKYLEGSGVTPDIDATLTRKSLLSGRDDQLEAALAWINDETAVVRKKTTTKSSPAVVPPDAAAGSKGDLAEKSKLPPTIAQKIPAPIAVPRAPVSNVKDKAALAIIDDFVRSIGGEAELKNIDSYELLGRSELLVKGTTNRFDLEVFYEKPNRYAEVLRSASAGEIREVHSGPLHFVQTDYGLTRDLPAFANTGDLDMLAPIRNIADKDFYRSLTFAGVFDREGRKVNLIDARTRDGYYLALAFDAETKELISFTGSYYAMTFSDYRKIGGLKLPYRIERERIMNIQLNEIKLNVPIDEAKFVKKENCFDKVD